MTVGMIVLLGPAAGQMVIAATPLVLGARPVAEIAELSLTIPPAIN